MATRIGEMLIKPGIDSAPGIQTAPGQPASTQGKTVRQWGAVSSSRRRSELRYVRRDLVRRDVERHGSGRRQWSAWRFWRKHLTASRSARQRAPTLSSCRSGSRSSVRAWARTAAFRRRRAVNSPGMPARRASFVMPFAPAPQPIGRGRATCPPTNSNPVVVEEAPYFGGRQPRRIRVSRVDQDVVFFFDDR